MVFNLYQIKNKKFITAENNNSQYGKDFVLVKGTKLSEVLDFLPYGRINKTETGIGATTCEFKSKRNSIIVQPLKITAEEKSKLSSDFFYYKSDLPIDYVSSMPEDLKDYLDDSSVKFKKIVLVADNLRRLYMDMSNYSVSSNYFLLIDEIDSIQKDSSFRKRMEDCIEVYKSHPFELRAMVTATMMSFSDPDLKDLKESPLTKFSYPIQSKDNIEVIDAQNPISTLVEEVNSWLKNKRKQDKLVVALNNVAECVKVANTINIANPSISIDDISILCGSSTNNELRTKDFNSELRSDKLSSLITFKTSAYFNGFDINESYDLMVVADASHPSTRLSEDTIIQIMGRCRVGLTSSKVIYKGFPKDKVPVLRKVEDLIQMANDEIDCLNCIEKHYDKNENLSFKFQEMRNMFISKTGIEGSLFVKNITRLKTVKPYGWHSDNLVAYLGIDSCLEDNRVARLLYDNVGSMIQAFRNKRYVVSLSQSNVKGLVKKSNVPTKKQLWNDFLKGLEEEKPTIKQLKAKFKQEKDNSKKGLLKSIIFGIDRGLTVNSTVKAVQKIYPFQSSDFILSIKYFFENDSAREADKPIKHNIQSLFNLGDLYTMNEIQEKYEYLRSSIQFFAKSNLAKGDSKVAKHFFSNFVSFKSKRITENHKKISKWEVVGFNPFEFKENKKKKVG